jgi:hypothetical protein
MIEEKMKKAAILVTICSLLSCNVYAIDDWTVSTKVTGILSYNQFGGGDVAFNVANPTTACPSGYWITKSDPGFSANFVILLAAYSQQTSIRVVGLPDQIWSGSSATYCKVYVISPS